MEVHPHACGDNRAIVSLQTPSQGSPPRVWGQHTATGFLRAVVRFTPTRVGTTQRHRDQNLRRRGSPPRVWGQLCKATVFTTWVRFTPTRVGTTTRYSDSPGGQEVHPHACGDNCNTRPTLPEYRGSPPRVWGQHSVSGVSNRRMRFTPTRVGTTWHGLEGIAFHEVHPHACGDNALNPTSSKGQSGSPPRVWGQRILPGRDRRGR